MKNRLTRSVILVLLVGAVLPARTARADPSIGYLDVAYALPWHYAFETEGSKVVDHELYRTFGIGAFSFGLGIPYSGLNAQLDFRNALNLTTGAATFGYRLKFSIIGFEFWGRVGIGPAIVFDTKDRLVRTSGAIATDFEAGVDYFLFSFLALEIKGVFTPQLYFDPEASYIPSFSGDVSLNVGIKLAI